MYTAIARWRYQSSTLLLLLHTNLCSTVLNSTLSMTGVVLISASPECHRTHPYLMCVCCSIIYHIRLTLHEIGRSSLFLILKTLVSDVLYEVQHLEGACTIVWPTDWQTDRQTNIQHLQICGLVSARELEQLWTEWVLTAWADSVWSGHQTCDLITTCGDYKHATVTSMHLQPFEVLLAELLHETQEGREKYLVCACWLHFTHMILHNGMTDVMQYCPFSLK